MVPAMWQWEPYLTLLNKVISNFSRIDTQFLHFFNTMMVRHLSMVIVFQPESTLTTIVVKGNNCLWEASLWQCQGRVILTLPNDWGLRGDQQASVNSALGTRPSGSIRLFPKQTEVLLTWVYHKGCPRVLRDP